MNGPQDLGGKQGLGTVPYEPDEPVFHSEWERRVFGLCFCSWLSSGVTVDESRWMQANMPYERYYGSLYYERWLYSLERLMVAKGVATEEELERGAALAEPAPPVVEPFPARRACGRAWPRTGSSGRGRRPSRASRRARR